MPQHDRFGEVPPRTGNWEAACARERNPLADAFELSHGLQDHHVDSRLILYEGFGHGIDKPKSALALMQANLDWFSHYLWNEPFPKDSPLYGQSEVGAEALK